MSFVDNAGFDVVIELPMTTIMSLTSSLAAFGPQSGTIESETASGEFTVTPTLTAVFFHAPTSFAVFSVNLTGSSLRVTAIANEGTMLPVPEMMQEIDLGTTTAEILDRIETAGLAVVIDFATAPLGGFDVTVTLDEETILASPIAEFILALAALEGEEALALARANLLEQIREALEDGLRRAVSNLGVITLVEPPSGLGVTDTKFQTTPTSFRLLYTIGGSPGAPDAITRSSLLPGDTLSLILSNAAVLHDFMRPSVTSTLGLDASGTFTTAHPLSWNGSAPLAPAGGLPQGVESANVTSVIGGIDGVVLRLDMVIVTTGVGGSFTLTSTVSFAIPITVTTSAGTIGIGVGPAGAPTVNSTVDIPLWVYAAATLTGGPLITAVLAAIDVMGGSLADGPVSTLLSSAIPGTTTTLSLPTGFPPVLSRAVSLSQSDSTTRTVPPPRDPYPAHDVILSFN